jgi:hypothetical protein
MNSNINNVFLDLIRIELLEEVELLKETSTKMEVFWKNEYDTFKKNVENKVKSLEEWGGAELREDSGYRMNELNSNLPNLQRYSSIILFHSFLENSLVQICERVSSGQTSKKYQFKRPESNILGKIKNYLMKITNGKFPNGNTMWREVINIRMVRNNIVHNSGSVEKDQKKCIKYIKDNNYLALENGLEECYDFTNHEYLKIIIKPGFLSHYINVIECLFEDVFKAVDGKMTNIIPISFKK